jgi:AcrR family transcriptional regulator
MRVISRQRKDGIQTRQRIIEAACSVFADKGYRSATIAEICRHARVNIALVNYHFRDKKTLYRAVWQHAGEQASALYPFNGGVGPDAPASERLRGHISALVQRMTDSGRLGQFHRLHMLETAKPNPFIDDVIRKIRQPHREQLYAVLRELLGPRASGRDIERCETSVIGQCLSVRLRQRWEKANGTAAMTTREARAYADHITLFSLAGIQAIRTQLEETKIS